MPVWAIIAIIVGVILVAAALGVGGWYAYRAYVRRLLLRIVVRSEEVDSASQALIETVTRLADAHDEELERFAHEPDSPERRALHELAVRGRQAADELDRMALPAALRPCAEALADSAFLVAREAGRVEDDHAGVSAIESLSHVDLSALAAYTQKSNAILAMTCEIHELDDTAVYGGGLYL